MLGSGRLQPSTESEVFIDIHRDTSALAEDCVFPGNVEQFSGSYQISLECHPKTGNWHLQLSRRRDLWKPQT
jgi:hypothetical protein